MMIMGVGVENSRDGNFIGGVNSKTLYKTRSLLHSDKDGEKLKCGEAETLQVL